MTVATPLLLPATAERLIEAASVLTVALAVLFAFAALAKLTNPTTTAREFRTIGLPLADPLARLVPVAELGAATLLLVRPQTGALVSFVLLTAFTAVLAAIVRSGRDVSCGCLGSANDAPVTVRTLARNGVLLLMAGAAATIESLTVPELPTVMAVGSVLLVATLLGQLVALRATIGRLWDLGPAGEPITDSTSSLDPDLKGLPA